MKVVMKMKKELSRMITGGLNVPTETLSALPLGTFRGREALSIENHKGIIAYDSDCIRICVQGGAVVVHGRDLTIASMGKDLLSIKGAIRIIELE